MTTYCKVTPPVPDALRMPFTHSPLCVFKVLTTHMHLHICTHTHVTRIRKSHDVLNDTPDTYFIRTDKIKLIARITHSTRGRVCNDGMRSTPYECRRVKDKGAINIKDKITSISIWKMRRRRNNVRAIR